MKTLTDALFVLIMSLVGIGVLVFAIVAIALVCAMLFAIVVGGL